MKFKDCLDDFFGSYISGDRAYNVLKNPETRISVPANVVFANGQLNGPLLWDEQHQVFKRPELQLVKEIRIEDPSKFLAENQDLAKSVRYILIEVPKNEN